jgi:hypothetical protein
LKLPGPVGRAALPGTRSLAVVRWPDEVVTMEQLALECWLGRSDPAAIAAWSSELDRSDPALDLRSLSSIARVKAFCEVARVRCGFPPCTTRGSEAAVAVLRDLCLGALEDRIALSDLAEAVTRLESVYVLDNTEPSIPVPVYLDELRELLDWCDASWTLANSSTLVPDLRRIHQALVAAAG